MMAMVGFKTGCGDLGSSGPPSHLKHRNCSATSCELLQERSILGQSTPCQRRLSEKGGGGRTVGCEGSPDENSYSLSASIGSLVRQMIDHGYSPQQIQFRGPFAEEYGFCSGALF